MSSFPPEHPENPSRPGTSEPRLLTRRDAEDEAAATRSVPQERPAFSGAKHRRAFHPLRSLDGLRARLSRKPTPDDLPTEPWPPRPRRRNPAVRVLHSLTLTVLWVAILGGLAILTFALYLRRDMRAALPQLDGDLHVAGLTAPVSITRDQQGVPTIQAETTEDLLFAQGFVAAQDRLWQMDALRRHAAGELAEIMGSAALEHDRQQRYLQLRAAADRAVAVLPPDQLGQLQAYSRGVNAFLEGNADRLPIEFHLLHYKPAPWTPRDSLLVALAMFQDLGTSYPVKLHREAFSQHLPPELLADLYPTKSFRDQPPTANPKDLTAIQPEVLQIPLDDSQVKLEIPRLGIPDTDSASRVSREACPECISGSNNWAVSGRHTASGKPMLSNDMHLSLSVPGVWYEATLRSAGSSTEPALDATGFSLPGTPFLIVGRNAHVAWSFTNLGADVQDIHIEHLRGSGDSTEFEQPGGSWAPVNHHQEVIHVRGGHDRTLDVETISTHIGGPGTEAVETPIISPLFPGEQRTLSLLWTPYVPQNLSSPFYAVDTAASGSALVASLASFGGPSLNLVYADDAGHIGYHAIGRIPIRGAADHHPRAPEQQLPPENDNPLPDESPEGEPTPENAAPGNPEVQPAAWFHGSGLFDAPHFLQAGYVVHRGRRVRTPRREEPAAQRRRVPIQPEPAEVQSEPQIAPVPERDYTVGLPIPAVPVDALDPAARWSGYIPFDELPGVTDPADGILATANSRVTPDDYPYFITDDWAPPYRTERIRRLLAGRTGLTPADMLAIETDTTSAFDLLLAQRLAYAVDHASDKVLDRDRKRLRQAADLLRAWQGNMALDAKDSPAAAIVAAARPAILFGLIVPQIARHDGMAGLSPSSSSLQRIAASYQWASETVALENILTFQPDRWLPPAFGNWNDFLASALESGLSDRSAPHDLSRWSYGAVHTVDIEHPVFGLSPLLPRLIGKRTGTGNQPISGDGTTIQATGHAFGPSERFTADLADPAATTGNIPTGQSGNPASPYFLSQFPAWLHGSTFALPLGGLPAQHTLRLLP